MKDIFIRRLLKYLKDKYGVIDKNANVRDSSFNYTRKFSVQDEGATIDFIIPKDDTNDVKIFFTHAKCRPTAILIELNIQNGQYTFSKIPNSKIEIKNLYLFAEKYLEDIRYMANNALDFILSRE